MQPIYLPSVYDTMAIISSTSSLGKDNERHLGLQPKPQTKTIYESNVTMDYMLLQSGNEVNVDNTQTSSHTDDDAFLKFDGDFESGNLSRVDVTMDKIPEYNLYLRNDPIISSEVDVKKQFRWFFFRVHGTISGRQYRLNVKNMSFPCYEDSHLLLRPVAISEAAYSINPSKGWSDRFIGKDIVYAPNEGQKDLCTLSFTLLAETKDDCFYIALTVPYTYTQLQNLLQSLSSEPQNKDRLSLRTLCHSAAGNRCDLLVITDNNAAKETEEDGAQSYAADSTGGESRPPRTPPQEVPKHLRKLIHRTKEDVDFLKSKRAIVVVARQAISYHLSLNPHP